MRRVRLALGPNLYYWRHAQIEAFYAAAIDAPVDVVYLGEVVCGKRHEVSLADWLAIGRRLAAAGKEVVLSTLALCESETDLRSLRRIVDNGEFAIEANDMGAVRLAAEARVRFVIGPHVNAYNPATLEVLRRCGAVRWVAPIELARESLVRLAAVNAAQRIESEVFGYGRLPLAFSARCFTARARDRGKDDCGFACIDDPDGLELATIDGAPIFALNGIQTQSARPASLAAMLGEVAAAGIDVLRLSPQSRHTWEIAQRFRDGLDGRLRPGEAAARIDRLTGWPARGGYWRARPGIEAATP